MCIVQNCHFKVWCKQQRIRVHSTTMVLTSTCIRSYSNCRKRLRNTYLCKSYAWSTITFKPMMHIVEGSNRGLGMLFGELHILRLNNEMSIHSHGVSHNSIFDLRPKLSGAVKGQCTTTVLLFYLRIIVVLSVRKIYLIEINL